MSETFIRFGHPNPKLIIWIESAKASPRGESLLYWHLKRLSLETQAVAVDYDCNAPKQLPREQTHVIAGKTICKPLTDASFVKYKHMKLLGRPIWLSHGFEYGLVTPAINYEINRLLYLAAQAAGLKPVDNMSVPMFPHFQFR